MMRKKRGGVRQSAEQSGAHAILGILAFEVAVAMSRAIHLHRSLSDAHLARLRSHTLASPALRALVSPDEPRLLALAAAEFLDALNRVADVAARLGRRCAASPPLLAFDHVYADLLAARLPSARLSFFLSKDAGSLARKMERLVGSTAKLYAELEALDDLERSAKKLPADEGARKAFDRKIQWRKQEVNHLRDTSLWSQSYGKVALLLARAVCTIYARLLQVFGEALRSLECFTSNQSQLLSGPMTAGPRRRLLHSGPIQGDSCGGTSGPSPSGQLPCIPSYPKSQFGTLQQHLGSNHGREGLGLHCRPSQSRGSLFMECLSLGSSVSIKDTEELFNNGSNVAATGPLVPLSGVLFSAEYKCSSKNEGVWFGPKSRLMSLALPSTVGGSGLAFHYANIIIIIEKLVKYPHLLSEEARDNLYQMLPTSLRAGLRQSLKSYVKNLAIYDAHLAHDWRGALDKILSWLAPMAHNMIQWQADQNFEQQKIVMRVNVLLLETLYFADREKLEAEICKLLVGLNYICRYEQQQNALLDCTSSLDFDDCIDWQVQY